MERLHFAFFAGVVVVFAATLSSVEAGGRKQVEACMQQTGTSMADIETFMKTEQASQPVKCMLSCSLQGVKFMTADGTIDTSFIKTQLPSSVAGVVDTCASKGAPEKDICQRAYVFLNCFIKAEPKVFIEFTTGD